MTELQEKQLKVLNDTCDHYNSTNRYHRAGTSECIYGGVGCAIRRLIPDKNLCDELDNMPPVSVMNNKLFKKLPPNLQYLGQEFLAELQFLHDTPYFWNSNGLTLRGLAHKKYIIDNLSQGIWFRVLYPET